MSEHSPSSNSNRAALTSGPVGSTLLRMTGGMLTGHLAMFAGVGKRVEWDVEKMQCTNLPEINRYVRREYRPGWDL